MTLDPLRSDKIRADCEMQVVSGFQLGASISKFGPIDLAGCHVNVCNVDSEMLLSGAELSNNRDRC